MAESDLGPLALSGATRWSDGTPLDEALLERSGEEVVVLPTGAAYERPERVIEVAAGHFAALGARVVPVMVLSRPDAENDEFAEIVRRARWLYLCGGSPLHLRSVLKDSLVLDALLSAWRSGATVAGSGAGALALTDPMVDPRGGAFTVGLGLVRNVASVLHDSAMTDSGLGRTLALLPSGCALVSLSARAAVLREPDGTWRDVGSEPSTVYFDGGPDGLEALAGKSVR